MMQFIPFIIGALLTALGLGKLWARAESSGKAKKEAEYALRREAELNRIKQAHSAVPAGSVQNDPFNRDTQ